LLEGGMVGLDQDGADVDAVRLGGGGKAVRQHIGRHVDEPPSRPQDLQGAEQVVAPDEVDDQVEGADGGLEADAGVVDDLIDAQGGEGVVLAGPGGADDLGAKVLGELHGQVPDPAAGGMDQHPLPWLQLGGVDQDLPGGEAGQGQRPGVLVIE
jgi:hypothetical protein